MKLEVKVKKLTDTAKLPIRGSKSAAGYDLFADTNESITIDPGMTKLFPTGLAFEIPEGYFGGLYPRSGLATKRDVNLINCVACVDADYRGEVMVALHNHSRMNAMVIEPHERIAQLIVQPFATIEFKETEELSETERGKGGFGSTGTK